MVGQTPPTGATSSRRAPRSATATGTVDWLPDEPIPPSGCHRYNGDVPVVFGHYWFEAPLAVTNPSALCVDYSAGTGGPLAAYRFDGEPELTFDKLVST